MDPQSLADQIHTVLRQNGYPDRKVRLPYHQIYRPAVDNGFSLDESLDILRRLHRVDHQRNDDRILFFPFVKSPPQCDSKIVDKAIRRIIRPALKESGFRKNRRRNSWRVHEHATCVINFQSFNAYHAELLGCTTFSVAVNAGIFFHDTCRSPWETDDVPEFPKEHECHLRMSPHKPGEYADGCAANNIWFIKPDGSNIDDALSILGDTVSSTVVPWFDRHLDLDIVLDRFVNDASTDEPEVYFGGLHSPARATVVCGLLVSRGNIKAARQYLQDSLTVDSSPGTRELQQEYLDLFNAQYPPA